MTHSPKLLVWALLGLPALAAPAQAEAPASHNPLGFGGAAALAASLPAADTRDLVREVIQRSPEIARARRLAAAAEARAPQVAALPDPVAAVTYFVRGPQTRTGAQRLRASLQQRLPWFGTLDLRERAALLAAARARAEVETARWRLATEARHAASELAFLGAYERIVRSERGTLERFEKVAQARYAAGNGLQQEIVRIQAQITTADTRLLEIGERRAALSSRINRLRDQPTGTPLPTPPQRTREPLPALDLESLRGLAEAHRPEIAAVEADLAAADARHALALRGSRPDLTVGLSYTAVEKRADLAGRLTPPEDDGDNLFALTASLNLPVRRRKLDAAVREAEELKWAAEEERRGLDAAIESTLGDLAARLPMLDEHLTLLEKVLITQAREALRSAEIAYSTGRLSAVDLLDAEVILLQVEIAAARTRADLEIALASLERAVARPLAGAEETADE